MKKLLVIALAIVAVCLIGSVAYAADNAEAPVTITASNPTTREIDTMVAFPAISVASADRDAGFKNVNSTGNLVVSSNAGYKLQVKNANPVGNMGTAQKVRYGGNAQVTLGLSYADLTGATNLNPGGAVGSPMDFQVDVGWTDAPFTNSTVDLYVKILTNV